MIDAIQLLMRRSIRYDAVFKATQCSMLTNDRQ